VGQHLFIVARDAPDLYSYLSKEFSSEPGVTVILDRRRGERRSPSERTTSETAERRQRDRRLKAEIKRQLATLGYAFVRLD
jgi:hypothetical protein